MYSTWLSLLVIVLLQNIISNANLRCHEDINGSLEITENCRACVIFIETNVNIVVSPRRTRLDQTSAAQELFFYNERKRRRRRRRYDDANVITRQKCAREYDGPLYGYNQTHCYCNSNRCNSNIQRCIYEIASKRYFSCYHGSNSSQNSLEISKKCRSCRIRIDSHMSYHYECLTFGEQEQNNRTHCTCQYPMCNQDLGVCQRFQQAPSQPRVNFIHKVFLNSTLHIPISATTTTTVTNTTYFSTTVSSTYQTERELATENSTLFQVTSPPLNDTNSVQTIIIEIKNHANYFTLDDFSCIFSILFLRFIY